MNLKMNRRQVSIIIKAFGEAIETGEALLGSYRDPFHRRRYMNGFDPAPIKKMIAEYKRLQHKIKDLYNQEKRQ